MVDVLDDEYALKLFAYSNKANLICRADQGRSSLPLTTCILAPVGQMLTGYFASRTCLRYGSCTIAACMHTCYAALAIMSTTFQQQA